MEHQPKMLTTPTMLTTATPLTEAEKEGLRILFKLLFNGTLEETKHR